MVRLVWNSAVFSIKIKRINTLQLRTKSVVAAILERIVPNFNSKLNY